MKDIDFDLLLARAYQVKNETETGANSAFRVGGLLVDMVEKMKQMQDEINELKKNGN